ncbi:hypothetical protein PR048_017266 [Dryococelus australis]|uniref:Uncharacterized protein n=1 Tax=Dryococelus australis TaxID=614101 RepID=A0ABQ9H985_9NEOP|nr:hypothetical protein PR048_017266 [Dryococelus australis]
MDQALRKQWELVVQELEIPTLSDFTDFLDKLCTSSEVIVSTPQKCNQLKSINNHKVPEQHRTLLDSFFVKSFPEECCLCKDYHTIHRCSKFVQKNPQARFSMAKEKLSCIICLQAAHQVKSFPSTISCRFYNARQNTMLHLPSDKPTTTVAQSVQDEVPVDTP